MFFKSATYNFQPHDDFLLWQAFRTKTEDKTGARQVTYAQVLFMDSKLNSLAGSLIVWTG
jgi:hypothetical protein